MASDVYFTDSRCEVDRSMLEKVTKLIKAAGIDSIDFNLSSPVMR